MSAIVNYFRNLFNNTNINQNRKRRRNDFVLEEPQFKYRRVSNLFPKTYNQLDNEVDFFQEVKQRTPLYNDLFGTYLMDQNKQHYKAILDDGEYSDEEDFTSFRVPSMQKRHHGYDFENLYQNGQPTTSAFTSRNQQQQFSWRNNEEDDDDVQLVSYSRKPNQQSHLRHRQDMPSLIPISKSSLVTNGHTSEHTLKPISAQPVRGRRSVLDFSRKNRAFADSPTLKATNSIISRNQNIDVKSKYDNLLKSLIPRFPICAFKSSNNNRPKDPTPIATIDLLDDNDSPPTINNRIEKSSSFENIKSSFGRKLDFSFKKPSDYVCLSDDEGDQLHFNSSSMLSSTQIVKTNDRRSTNDNKEQIKAQTPFVQPINSLRDKHSLRPSLQADNFEKIVLKFQERHEKSNRSIAEEEENALKLEKDRMHHEKVTQRKIDESITSALSEKCIIIEEEEDVIDEFPPLNEQQTRIVQFALHGPRQEVIVTKFSMNITRHDLATLDGLNWLNDEVINFYMELIKERSEQIDHLPRVHVMNTFFLGKLLQNGHSGVRRWTRKVDIFSFDIIPVPVHVGGVHWCMSVIHFKNKTIRYYDSMGHPNNVVLDALTQYLKDESMDKKKVPFDTKGWKFECIRDCPQQKNGSDCGVFSCQFAEFISRDSQISFEQQHMPYFRRKMICEIATGKLLLGH